MDQKKLFEIADLVSFLQKKLDADKPIDSRYVREFEILVDEIMVDLSASDKSIFSENCDLCKKHSGITRLVFLFPIEEMLEKLLQDTRGDRHLLASRIKKIISVTHTHSVTLCPNHEAYFMRLLDNWKFYARNSVDDYNIGLLEYYDAVFDSYIDGFEQLIEVYEEIKSL